MAKPKKLTLQGNGSTTSSTNPYVTNWRHADPVIALGFDTDGSTTAFTVQYALDDTHLVPVAEWTWFDHADMAAMTAKEGGSLAFPVTAIRLQANGTGTDTGSLLVVESGG